MPSRRSVLPLAICGLLLAKVSAWGAETGDKVDRSRLPAPAGDPREEDKFSPEDPAAKSVGFTTDVTHVDTNRFPAPGPNRFCATCESFQKAAGNWAPKEEAEPAA